MTIFYIFKYNLRVQKKSEYLFKDDPEYQKHAKYASPNDLFESFLGKASTEIPGIAEIKKKSKDDEMSELVKYGNRIEQHKDHIIYFKVQSNHHTNIDREDWKREKVDDHPDSKVIIDNRPDRQYMIIERKTTSFKDPKKLLELLKTSFNNMMQKYGVTIEFKQLVMKDEFWKTVNEIRTVLKDSIGSLEFDFSKSQEVLPDEDRDFVTKLMNWISIFAKDGKMDLGIDDDGLLEKVQEDLNHMAEICMTHKGYDIIVRFRMFGVFRFGQEWQAQYGLEDNVLEEFVCSSPKQLNIIEYQEEYIPSLSEWFDKIHILFKRYDNETPVEKRRKIGGRI